MTNAIPASLAPRGPLRILGLDPGLRRTGWGVVAVEGARLTHVAHGVIAPDTDAPFADRLLHLFEAIGEVIAAHGPHEAAVEETFMNNNAASALKLGHARACALLAPAQAGLTVAEYGNSVIKKAVVGTGAADKGQVGFMIARLLPTAGKTTADAADALAVAIAHAHVRTARPAPRAA
jgi:crossover junction endodeoxyribonuclease RuvC